MKQVVDAQGHLCYFDEGTHLLLGLVLAIANYVQFEYTPSYKAAVMGLFPRFFDRVSELQKGMAGKKALERAELSDDEIYTAYACYDLVGRLLVSDLYEVVVEGMSYGVGPEQAPDLKKKVYAHTLSNLRPFMQAVELYALQNGKLPALGALKARLERLPVLN